MSAAVHRFEAAADVTGTTLYQANLCAYQLLRYDVPVQLARGPDSRHCASGGLGLSRTHDFALAQEVTLKEGYERHPDLVLYLNGIAIGVIEFKRGSVEVGDGISQLITNQKEMFNRTFFGTVQFVFAGNDLQGLRYSTTGTPERFLVEWKDEIGATADELGALLGRLAAGANVPQGTATRSDCRRSGCWSTTPGRVC